MIITSPIDSASTWLNWSNVLYIVGAVLTLIAAMHVRHEKRSVDAGQRSKVSFASEASVIAAAIVSLAGTAMAVYFSSKLSDLKDADLKKYQIQAAVEISRLNSQAKAAELKSGEAAEKAGQAILEAERSELERVKLESRLQEVVGANSSQQKKIGLLEVNSQDRQITKEQEESILASLKLFFVSHGTMRHDLVRITQTDSSFEAAQYAGRIGAVMLKAGLEPRREQNFARNGRGVSVVITLYMVSPLALGIEEAFRNAGIQSTVRQSDLLPYGFEIEVGAKTRVEDVHRR